MTQNKDKADGVGNASKKPRQTYHRLLGYASMYRTRLGLGILFGLLCGGAHYALVWVVRDGFNHVFDPQGADLTTVIVFSLFFPAVGLAWGLTDFLSAYYMRWVGNRVVMDLRNQIFERLQRLSLAFFSGSRTGELISRVTNDTLLVERAVSTVVADLVKQPFVLLAMVVSLLMLDWQLTIASLIVFPLCIVPVAIFGRRARRLRKEAQEHLGDCTSILQEAISGAKVVRAFGMEQYESDRFRSRNRSLFGRLMRVVVSAEIVNPIIIVIATFGVAAVFAYVCYRRMNIGNFAGYMAALFMLYEPIKKLSKMHIAIQQSSAAADRVFEIIDTESTVQERPGAQTFQGPVQRVRFESVAFAYDAEPVLSGIDLDVRAGERVALVGSSGSGKTTLVNLVPRFFDVTNGRLLFNDKDVRTLTLRSVRAQIGLVTQETFLFNDTVANNIAYGLKDASREDIEAAARRAHAHDFITAMVNGYDTVIGERGVRLSGGQQQRLAIARAILRNPPILILDEATSALDTESERMVQAALDEVMTGRTVFAIAHRLSTIVNCDRIVVLEKGRIAEEGTHEDLLAKHGIYKRLYDLQFDVPCGEEKS